MCAGRDPLTARGQPLGRQRLALFSVRGVERRDGALRPGPGGPGRKDLRHPRVGMLSFSHAVFHPSEAAEQRLVMYTPLPENDTPAKLAMLLEESADGDQARRPR